MPPKGRQRVSAYCASRNSAGSHWCGNTSQALRASSPQGEPSLSGDAAQSLSLRRGGTRSVTERCAAQRAAARERLLRKPKLCGKPLVRQHLSGASRQLPSRGAFPLRRRSPKPLLEERWHAKPCRRGVPPRSGGGAKAPSAHAETLWEAFGAVTPLQRSWMENSTGLRP